MSPELLHILQFVLGVGFLIGGAYLLVEGGSRVAVVLGVKPVVVGLTVVAFGTSAPEFFVSVIGLLKHNTDLVLGNVIGSNVANIGLILAVAAIVRPVRVEKGLPRLEIPLLVGVTLLFTAMALDRDLSTVDGIVLTLCFVGFMWVTVRSGDRGQIAAPTVKTVVDPRHRSRELAKGAVQAVLGMGGLAGGGQLIVTSAVALAKMLGLSDSVIGLTLVAVGTSLPELATTIMAAIRKQDDLALGNIIGSNLFNLLGVAGPLALFGLRAQGSITVDLGAMCVLTLVVALMILWRREYIGRFQGGALLTLYAVTIFLWVK